LKQAIIKLILKCALALFTAFLVQPALLNAQNSQENFGKNRVQYRKFDWQLLSSQSIDLYFYSGGETLAKTAIEMSETEFRRISDLFGFTPYHKLKIFLCLSTNDRLMSNLGLGEGNFQTGGKTTFTKSIAEVAYEGSLTNLRKQLSAGIAQIMIRDMLFGGSLKEALQNSYLLNLPDWFIGGAIKYAAEGSGPDMEDLMKELAVKKKIRQPANFVGTESYLIGQSIWNFIGSRFGRSTVGNILNLTRIMRNEEKAIVGTLGMPFPVFLREWRIFYQQMPTAGLSAPPEDFKKGHNSLKKNYRNLCFTPEENFLIYSADWKGKFQILRLDLKTGNSQIIFRGGSKIIQQNSEGEFPAVCPGPEGRLIAAYPQKGIWQGVSMNLRGKDRKSLDWFKDFHEVNSMKISPNGKYIVVSGSLGAYSDIFLFNTGNGKMRRLTQDWYDDLDPFFSLEGDSIYFSTNRIVSDSIVDKPGLDPKRKLALYAFSVKDPEKKPALIFQSAGNISKGQMLENGRIACLSDEQETRNVLLLERNGKKGMEIFLTNSLFNISEFAYSEESRSLAYTARLKQKPALFLGPPLETIRLTGGSILQNEPIKTAGKNGIHADSNKIDIQHYIFEEEKLPSAESKQKEVRKREKARFKKESKPKEIEIQGPVSYQPIMTANHLTTGLQINPVPTWGLGTVLDFSMHDLFENHHINGGMTFFLNDLEFKNNASYLEYQFLQHRVDFKIRGERKAIQNSGLNQLFRQRDILQNLAISCSYPFSNALRLEINPFFQQTKRSIFDIRNIGLGGEDRKINYFGAASELVFDNTTKTGMNLQLGTRFRARAQYQIAPAEKIRNFGEVSLDFRSYLPIHREITFAFRASYGNFFGNSPKKYMLGGVDNWLFRSYHVSRQKDDPLLGFRDDALSLNSDESQSNWLFNRYCTNLRGYRYNAAYGTSFLLFNWEVRVPIIRYIYKGPINSNFWRNLQLTAFADMGAGWTGTGPWNKNNSLNTREINEGNFSIKVKSYENPFLASYGFGARTIILGYYAKLDLAWPSQKDSDLVNSNSLSSEEYKNSSRLMLSLGHDF
jgi:hypothetical protein